MRVGIVELGADLSKIFQSEVGLRIETAEFEVKKALDLFDVLAYARKMINDDQLVLIVQMNSEEADINKVFLQGLASLEGETGKNIFKCFYYEDEDGESKVKELAETFFNYLFHPDRLEKKKSEEGSEFPL